jgi:hypothetical protein
MGTAKGGEVERWRGGEVGAECNTRSTEGGKGYQLNSASGSVYIHTVPKIKAPEKEITWI